MPLELLWLLLPVAAASGWWAASRQAGGGARRSLPREYFRGLDHLLNEEPDKAIEAFVRMVEIDSDTLEPHFALGSLFRRQGEVERAIRIHQNLIARPALPREQRNHALYELGRDYHQAGLLDRAEAVLSELLADDPRHHAARALLIDVYEQEKEWEKAIEVACGARGGRAFRTRIAHYYCELAEEALAAGDFPRVRRMIRRAYANDRGCVRASLLAGESARCQGRHRAAVRALLRIEKQDTRFLSEAIAPLIDSYERLGRGEEAVRYLADVVPRQMVFRAVDAAVRFLRSRGRGDEAARLLATHLGERPSLPAAAHLLESLDEVAGPGRPLGTARDTLHRLVERIDAYHCDNCGYGGNTLRWQCPGCRSWSTVRPWEGVAA